MTTSIELEATHLRDKTYAVRPKGQLGTCGWSPKPWGVIYLKAKSKTDAIRKAVQLDHFA